MDRSIISACQTLDDFGLPRAVGNLSTDRLVAANCSFLRLVGFQKSEIFGMPLSEIVSIQADSKEAARTGRLIPIIIQSAKERQAIGGHAAIGDDDLVFLMVHRFLDPSPDFEVGAVIGKEQERQAVASYVHEKLAPEFMSAVYRLESIRAQLEKERHPSASKLKEIQDQVTEPLQRMASELNKSVTEQRKLSFAARRLAAIVEDSDDAIISKDLNGIVLSWNKGAERIFGYSAEEMIGTSITRIIPLERQEEEEQILSCLRRGERYSHFETIRLTKGGGQLWVSLTVSPIKDENGKVIGASKIAREITGQEQQHN